MMQFCAAFSKLMRIRVIMLFEEHSGDKQSLLQKLIYKDL